MSADSKYWKLIARIVKHSDIIIEIIDARCPKISRNTHLENLAKSMDKKLVIIINKTDLVSYEFAEKTKKEIEKEYPTAFMAATGKMGTSFARKLIGMMIKDINKEQKNTPAMTIISIVGYPNVGKSSLINALRGKKVTSTSPKPGHTKKEKWIKLSEKIRLSDTPGVIHQKEEPDILKGIVDLRALKDLEEDTINLLSILLKHKNNLAELYKIKESDPNLFIKELTKKRGNVLKGGEPDTDRTYIQIINDWNRGKITTEIDD